MYICNYHTTDEPSCINFDIIIIIIIFKGYDKAGYLLGSIGHESAFSNFQAGGTVYDLKSMMK